MIGFSREELDEIEWAQLVLMGVRPDDIPGLNRQQIATLLAVHTIQTAGVQT